MAMPGNVAKARQFIEDGEKCLTKWSIFGNITKHEDAAENFEKAGRLYKASRRGFASCLSSSVGMGYGAPVKMLSRSLD